MDRCLVIRFGTVSLLALNLSLLGACTEAPASGSDDTSSPQDSEGGENKDTGSDAADQDTGSDEPGQDTGQYPLGESCEAPFILENNVKFELEGWHHYFQYENRWDWGQDPSCYFDECMCVVKPEEDWDACDFSNPIMAEGCWDCFDTPEVGCGAPGPEFVFNASMKAGQRFVVDANGGTDPHFRVLDECSHTSTCVQTSKVKKHFEWVAPSDGEYFMVLEEAMPIEFAFDPYFGYKIGIFDTTEFDCGDGLDNDGDSFFDCLDPECYESCGVFTLLHETFESQLPSDWIATADGWHFTDESGSPKNDTPSISAGGCAIAQDTQLDYSAGAFLDTPDIDIDGSSSLALVFAHRRPTRRLFPMYQEVQARVDGGAWQTVLRFDSNNTGRTFMDIRSWEIADLSDLAKGGSKIALRFHFNDGSNSESVGWTFWEVDDITLLSGEFDVHGASAANLQQEPPFDPAATGCDGQNAKCEVLFGHDFGDCSEPLGWYFDGDKCREAIGCTEHSYCLYEDIASCSKGCATEGKCNMKAFLDPSWPTQGGYTECDYFKICTTQAQWEMIPDIWPTSTVNTMAVYCSQEGHSETTHGGRAYPEGMNEAIMTPESWELLCSYSMLPDTIEMSCFRDAAGAF